MVSASCLANTIVTTDFVDLGGAVTLNLAAMNVKGANINLAVQFGKELFIQLNCQQDARSDHYNGLGAVCCLKTTQTVKDHRKGLATARRAGDTTDRGSQQGVKDTLLVRA